MGFISNLADLGIARVAGATLAGIAPVVVSVIPIACDLISPPAVYAKEIGLLQEPKTGLCERMWPNKKVKRELESERTTVYSIDFLGDGTIDHKRTTTERTYNVTGPYCAFCGIPLRETLGGHSKAEGKFQDGVNYVEYVDIDNDREPDNIVRVTFKDGTMSVEEDLGADGSVDSCYEDDKRINCGSFKR